MKYTVECEYYATGEGIHYYLLYCDAESEADALAQFNKKYGVYMGSGAEIKKGWILDGDIQDMFLTLNLKDALEMDCHVGYSAELHINCS